MWSWGQCIYQNIYYSKTTFSTFSGKYRGKYLLDIGSGPVVHPVITASQWFDEVYVSDISLENVNLLQKWLRGESEHMEHLMKEFSEMEGKGLVVYIKGSIL